MSSTWLLTSRVAMDSKTVNLQTLCGITQQTGRMCCGSESNEWEVSPRARSTASAYCLRHTLKHNRWHSLKNCHKPGTLLRAPYSFSQLLFPTTSCYYFSQFYRLERGEERLICSVIKFVQSIVNPDNLFQSLCS